MKNLVIDKLVDNFLKWKLPETFSPDCFINFDHEKAKEQNSWPVGTNLFTAENATKMIKDISNNLPMLSEYLSSQGTSLYTYNAKVVKIIDADTVDLLIDLGFSVYKKLRCRLAGLNSPELNTAEGKAARDFLVANLPINEDVIVISKEYDKYGRSLGVIYYKELNINKLLLDSGHAVVYK